MAQPGGDKAFHVSWDQFHRDARVLAWRLADKGPFKAIVCVTRGGLVPAAIVARELGVRQIETICVSSYEHDRRRELELIKPLGPEIVKIGGGNGAGLLVIDDLTDTGQTAKLVRSIVPEAHFAAIYAKPSGAPLIDTWVTEVSQDTWIYFPWDMGLSYQEPIKKGAG